MDDTADALDVGLLQFSAGGRVIGTGGFIDTANQRLADRARPADRRPRATSPRSAGRGTRGDAARGSATWPIWSCDHQPLIGDAVINDGPGLLLIVEKFPWGNTLDVTRGVEAGARRAAARPDRASTSTPRSSGRRLHRDRDRQPHHALLIGCILRRDPGPGRLPLRVADGPDQPRRDPALADGRGAGALPGAATRSTRWSWPGLSSPRRGRRRRDHRRREHRAAAARAPARGQHRSRRPAIILDASLEVRSAIVYATLIDVIARRCRSSSCRALPGAFFRPLASSYALAVLASMVVALTVTPALCLLLLRDAPLDAHGVAAGPAGCRRGYGRVLVARSSAGRAAAVRRSSAVAHRGGALRRAVPRRSRCFPTFKERDFLMHWITKPGTSLPEEMRGSPARSARSCGRSRASATSARTSARPSWPTRSSASNFGENWISIDPKADYDKTVARDPGRGRRLSRAVPRRARPT